VELTHQDVELDGEGIQIRRHLVDQTGQLVISVADFLLASDERAVEEVEQRICTQKKKRRKTRSESPHLP
jgi:hypothetical protein